MGGDVSGRLVLQDDLFSADQPNNWLLYPGGVVEPACGSLFHSLHFAGITGNATNCHIFLWIWGCASWRETKTLFQEIIFCACVGLSCALLVIKLWGLFSLQHEIYAMSNFIVAYLRMGAKRHGDVHTWSQTLLPHHACCLLVSWRHFFFHVPWLQVRIQCAMPSLVMWLWCRPHTSCFTWPLAALILESVLVSNTPCEDEAV